MKIIFIEDADTSRILANVGECENYGVMAFRGNLSRKKELIKVVRKNYGFIEMKCVYRGTKGSKEDQFLFIPKIKKIEMIELGKKQNEFSVISKNNNQILLIGTNQIKDNSVGKIHRKEEYLTVKENLKYNYSVFSGLLSQLLKDSHNEKEIQINQLQVQEKVETSMYYYKEHGPTWTKIIELDFRG